ncbi:MAG: hypothetical protein PVJ76_05295 [Gemmatimonadota bacterium]
MARCEGTTRDGDRCKRNARPGSRYCYVHDPEREEVGENGGDAGTEEMEIQDLAPLLLAGVLAAGLVFLLKGFGKWIPRF